MHSDFDPIVSRDTSAAHGPNDDPVLNDLRSELRTAWAKVSRLEQSERELQSTVARLEIELEDAQAQVNALRSGLISRPAKVGSTVPAGCASADFADETPLQLLDANAFPTDEDTTASSEDTLLSRGEFAAMRNELKRADLRINQLMSQLDEVRDASCPNELFHLRADLAEAHAQIERQNELITQLDIRK